MQNRATYILDESSRVTSADTDFTKTLRASSLVNMLIQIAWHHAEILGFGMDFLHSNELVWILSRMHIKFYSKTSWNNKLRLSTWPKGINRLFYLRDFEVEDDSKNSVARATSEWLIIDLQTRRPKLYQPENNIFQENKDRHAITSLVAVLKCPDSKYSAFSNKVVYSDVDLNNHLTTTRYIDWMMDTFDLKFFEMVSCTDMILNFLREIPFGSKVLVRRYELEPNKNYLFEYLSSDEGQVYFRGQLQFSTNTKT